MGDFFGLKNNSKIKIYYDVETNEIAKFEGVSEKERISMSEHMVFSMPMCAFVGYVPFYPSKYEIINKGIIVYASSIVPTHRITIRDSNFLMERVKDKKSTISPKDLQLNMRKKRSPSQNQVMGESAKNHAESLINEGLLQIDSNEPISWHWCHLVAFSMLPTEKAQTKSNLVCGTAACNGHMTNIETAVKKFIHQFNRPLSLEVKATVYAGTHMAIRIGYKIYDKKSRLMHAEYFNALTDVKTDIGDYETIYNRMVERFNH